MLELFYSDYLVVCFFFVEDRSLPKINGVLIVFVARNVVLCPDAENQIVFFSQVIEVEHSIRFVPVWVGVKSWLHVVFLVELILILAHLNHHRSYLFSGSLAQVNDESLPLEHLPIKFVLRRSCLPLEEHVPELVPFAALCDQLNIAACFLVFL